MLLRSVATQTHLLLGKANRNMSIDTLVRRSKQLISDNAPTILTGAGIAGTVVTAVIAARQGYKAGYRMAEVDLGTPITKPADVDKKDRAKQVTKLTWKLYFAPSITGVGTIASIAMANRVHVNRTAALATAYTLADKAFAEYKEKTKEVVGEKKEDEIHTKVIQDRVNNTGDRGSLVVISNNDVLCYDAFTDRYFQSSMEKIKKAENDTNHEIINNLYVSLSEFYSKLGLPPTGFSDEVGWNSDNLVELRFTSVMTPNEQPALAISFHVDPIRGFDRAHG